MTFLYYVSKIVALLKELSIILSVETITNRMILRQHHTRSNMILHIICLQYADKCSL